MEGRVLKAGLLLYMSQAIKDTLRNKEIAEQ
jgi:hypothetical protein